MAPGPNGHGSGISLFAGLTRRIIVVVVPTLQNPLQPNHSARLASESTRVVHYGERIAGDVPVFQLADGGENAELVGARSPRGSLLLNWWKPSRDWQTMNLSDAVGRHHIVSDPEAWITPSGGRIIEHVAVESRAGSLLVFWNDSQGRVLTEWFSLRVGLVTGMVTGAGVTINPYIEYYADNLPERRLGVFGIGLILCGFALQSLQYWLALLDVHLI